MKFILLTGVLVLSTSLFGYDAPVVETKEAGGVRPGKRAALVLSPGAESRRLRHLLSIPLSPTASELNTRDLTELAAKNRAAVVGGPGSIPEDELKLKRALADH